MKIVCESCGAKYSIADDRVVGKMFKIRCKRCSEVIVVRGDQQQQPAPAAASPAATSAGDPAWHVVVEGEQAGPYTPQQLQEMLGRGAIDWDAYVWTEGFDNWIAMREVDALVSQLGGPKARGNQPAAEPPFRGRSGGDTLVGQPSMGADPFADDSAPAGDAFPPARTPAPDLFARAGQSMPAPAYRDGDQAVMVAAAPGPRVTAERAMTGARNENSVLFSLKNLQALATGSGSGAPPPATASTERGGYASGEGSGLIDIRALATATGTGVNDAKAPAHRDDLLAMGTQGGAFGALGSPILSPASDEGDGNKKTIVWGAVASIALLSLSAIVIVYMVRSPTEAPARMIVEPPAAQQPPEPAQPAAPSSPAERPAAAAAPEAERPAAGETDPAARASSEHVKRRVEPPPTREPAAKPAAPDGKTIPAAVAAPPKTRTKDGPPTLDDLLDNALGSGAKPGQAAAEPAPANLAETPTREQVLTAMTSVKPAVQECAKGSGAIATVTVNVAGVTGHVTNAQVAGVTGPEGSCIAQAVRKAVFPRFAQKTFKVTFPYKL